MKSFKEKLRNLINYHSKENGSNTSDIILADYLVACLEAFDNAVNKRSKECEQMEQLDALNHTHPISNIVVNGVSQNWPGYDISYDDIVQLAYPGLNNQLFSVAYCKGVLSDPDGILDKHGSVSVRPDMRFDVADTSST